MRISSIICTFNPRADYLRRCLEALQRQTLQKDQWEILVVDNRSDEPLAGRIDLTWHCSQRLVREETLGLTSARIRGIRESKGELLVFVDDDNLLDSDYLEQVVSIAKENPFLGSWSGECLPEFDEPPPEWTRRYWGNLCIREFEQNVWSNLPRLPDTMPWGAGLSVRRAVAEHYLQIHDSGQRSVLLDRVGDSLVSGGDNDLAACACDLGLGVGLNASLKLKHLIPPQRLTVEYLCRLAESIEYSSLVLDAERGGEPPARGLVGTIADQLRTLRLRGPHRKVLRAAFRGRAAAVRFLASKELGPQNCPP